MQNQEVRILGQTPENKGVYENYDFHPRGFARHHTDVGFVQLSGCTPNCSFYDGIFTLKNQTSMEEQFQYKYLVDVDGTTFSGRWRAFLQSKSLGIKGTIFREWHDSRLFAWRHFVPMDNRYDDLYTILTYFMGYGKEGNVGVTDDEEWVNREVYIARHDFEARKLARQGSEWAAKVLRKEDMEVNYVATTVFEYRH
jgi:hypothetical protein